MAESGSESGIEKMGFLEKIDFISKQVVSGEMSSDELKNFARSPLSEEIIFNVIEKVGSALDQKSEVSERLLVLGNERVKVLKSTFPKGKQTNRSFPGKMEYDTTLDSLKRLNDKIKGK